MKLALLPGTIIAFYMYLSKFFNPIQNIADQVNTVQRAFSLLVEEGYIINIPKKGFYVLGKEKDKRKLIANSIAYLYANGIDKKEIIKTPPAGRFFVIRPCVTLFILCIKCIRSAAPCRSPAYNIGG